MIKTIVALCWMVGSLMASAPLMIGIAGGTGAGKTTLAHQIKESYGDRVTLISQDNYYKDGSHLPVEFRHLSNFDHPDSIDFELLIDQLKQLKSGNSIECPTYSFVNHVREEPFTVAPSPVIVVEGILIFAIPELRELFDITIYVDASDDIRLLRRIERDLKERGYDMARCRDSYLEQVKPMHDEFVAPSKQYADMIVSTEGERNKTLTIIQSLIQAHQ